MKKSTLLLDSKTIPHTKIYNQYQREIDKRNIVVNSYYSSESYYSSFLHNKHGEKYLQKILIT